MTSVKKKKTTKYHWPDGLYSLTDSQLLIQPLFLHSKEKGASESQESGPVFTTVA